MMGTSALETFSDPVEVCSNKRMQIAGRTIAARMRRGRRMG